MCLQSKFQIPKAEGGLFAKPEVDVLFEKTQTPFVIVKAMSGFGKTSVFAQAVRKRTEGAWWYNLDVTDNDSDCFLSALEQMWEKIEGKTGSSNACGQRMAGFDVPERQSRAIGTNEQKSREEAAGRTTAYRLLSLVQRVREWENLPDKQQDFLRKTAVFDCFTWEMCQSVFSESFSRQDFAEAVSNEGFVQKLPGETESYQYGRAFRAYFFCRMSVKEKTQTYQKAALWYEQKKDFVRMAEYAVSGRQSALVRCAVERYGRDLLSGKNRRVLGRMIEYLEKNAVLLSPEISGIAAQYFYVEGNFYKMEGYLRAADSAFAEKNKYGCYLRLYRGLLRQEEEPGQYESQIQEAVVFLKMTGQRLPYLAGKEKERLRMMTCGDKEKKQEKLYVQMFGECRAIVLADGMELNWRTKKGRELFAYLLEMGGKGVGRRRLIETLWQDEIPENAVAMLHNMIYNIRKELSGYHLETLITYENRRYRIATEQIETDLWQIQALAKLVEQNDVAALKKQYKYFLEYWGGYLEDLDSFWMENRKAYYDEIFKKGCRMLADDFVKEKEYEKGLKLYENILFLDAYSEETVEKMIQVYGRQKKWKKLKQCFENLETLLRKDLGICPGEAVLAAYHKYL